jgi:CHAD domain-containing protein
MLKSVAPRETRPVLDEATPLERAVRSLLARELGALLAEREGLEADRDPEPLHRARVALRRSRTWMRQLRRELPGEYRQLARETARVARRGGTLRDLDLLLEWLEGQEGSLGPRGATTLDRLTSEVRRRRKRARATWRRCWTSARTADLIERWSALTSQTPLDRASPPVGRVVRERLIHRHVRLLEMAERVTPGSPAADFHALRIECKKLRYLLEGFAGLFDPQDIPVVLDALRRLQGALGDANDAEVQLRWLDELGHALARDPRVGPDPWRTIGRLWERVEARGQRARERFGKRFETYRDEGARARLERLLQRSAG